MPRRTSKTAGIKRLMDPLFAQFILLASHGLRDPVTEVRWGLEALVTGKVGKLTTRQGKLLTELHESTKELTVIIRSMLILSRYNEGKVQPHPTNVRFSTLLDETVKLLRSALRMKGIQACVVCPSHLVVRMDRALIQDILTLLLLVCVQALDGLPQIRVSVVNGRGHVAVKLRSLLRVPILRHYGKVEQVIEDMQTIGGTPGLLIFLAAKLASILGCTVTVQRGSAGDTILSLRIPV